MGALLITPPLTPLTTPLPPMATLLKTSLLAPLPAVSGKKVYFIICLLGFVVVIWGMCLDLINFGLVLILDKIESELNELLLFLGLV